MDPIAEGQATGTKVFLFSFIYASDVWRLVYICFLVPYLANLLNANYWQICLVCAGGILFSKLSEWVVARPSLKDYRAGLFAGLSLISLLARVVFFTIHAWGPLNTGESNLPAIIVALCFNALAQLSTRFSSSLSFRLRPKLDGTNHPFLDLSMFIHYFLAFAVAAAILLAYLKLFPFPEQFFYHGAFIPIDASCIISSIFMVIGLSFKTNANQGEVATVAKKDKSEKPDCLACCSSDYGRRTIPLRFSSFLFSMATHSFFYFAIEWYTSRSLTMGSELNPIPSALDIFAANQIYFIMLFVSACGFLIRLPLVCSVERSRNDPRKFHIYWVATLVFAAPIVAAFFVFAYSSNQLLIDIAFMAMGLSYVTLGDIVSYFARKFARALKMDNIQGINSMFSFWTWLGELFAIILSSLVPRFCGYSQLFLIDGILAALGWILLLCSSCLVKKSKTEQD
jgi:hypothetical protein